MPLSSACRIKGGWTHPCLLCSTTRNTRSDIRIVGPIISIRTKIPDESVPDLVLTGIFVVLKKSGLNYKHHFRRGKKKKPTLKTCLQEKNENEFAGGGTTDTHPSAPRCQVKARNMTKNININNRCPSLPNPRRVKAVRCHNEVQRYQF